MDESRKQFEESWLRRGGESSDLIRYPENHHEIGSGNIGGQYVMDDVQGHWQTWQASREAIVLDMPEPFKLAKSSSGLTYYYQDEVDAVLGCAGIKVKE